MILFTCNVTCLSKNISRVILRSVQLLHEENAFANRANRQILRSLAISVAGQQSKQSAAVMRH